MGRPLGSTNRVIARGRIQDVVTPEQYKQIIENLVNIALTARSDRDKIAATKIIIEYLEGKPKESIEITAPEGLTVKDILTKKVENVE